MKEIKIDKVFPIQEITSNALVNGEGSITYGFSFRYPGIFEQSHQAYLDSMHAVQKVINQMPVNTIFHQQDIVYTDSYKGENIHGNSRLAQEYHTHFAGRPILRHYTNVYITFVNGTLAKLHSNKSSLLRQANYIFKRPFANAMEVISKSEQYVDSIYRSLKGIKGASIHRMNKEQLKRSLHEYWSLDFTRGKDYDVNSALPPQAIDKGYFKIGSKHVGIISMVGESKELASSNSYSIDLSLNEKNIPLNGGIKLPYSWSYPITLGFPQDHITNTFIHRLDAEVIAQLVKGGPTAKQTLMLMGWFVEDAKTKSRYIYGSHNIPGFFTHVSENSLEPCRVGSNIIVWDANPDKLSRKVDEAKRAYQAMGETHGIEENEDLANLFYLSSPGNNTNNYRNRFITTTNHAVCYLPRESQILSHKNGLMFTHRNGEPLLYDIDNAYGIKAKNGVLFGPTGKGKSVLFNNIIDQSIDSGIVTIIIDVGGSYEKTVKSKNGVYFDTSNRENLQFNPFTDCERKDGKWLYNATDEDNEGGDDQINYVYTILKKVSHGNEEMSKVAREIYKDLIIKYYVFVNQHNEFPCLNGFVDFIDRYKQDYAQEGDENLMNFHALKRAFTSFYKGGVYEKVLNSPKQLDLSKQDLIAFDMQGIKDDADLCELVINIIIRTATRIIENRRGEKKRLVIDEAIDFLSGESGEFIAGQYRKIRKRDGSVFLGTQGITYLMALDQLTMSSILGNSPIRMLMSHRDNRSDYKYLKEHLSLTEDQLEQIESIDENQFEVFLAIGNYSTVVRNEITPYQLGHYTTNPDDLNIINKYHKQFGHLGVAIEEFINKHLKKQTA